MIDRVEVAIVGGGLAGLGMAALLASRGVRVALFEARAGPARGASGRDPGVLLQGLPEPAWRLVEAIGEDRTREVYALSARGLAAVRARVPVVDGVLHVGVGEREVDELDRSAEALRRMGIEASRLDGPTTNARLGSTGFDGGLRVAADGSTDPRALAASLVAEATGHGATLAFSHRVDAVVDLGDDRAVRGTWGMTRADVVVFAGGHALRDLNPWFGDKLLPVREHALATRPVQARIGAGRAQLGYVAWRQDDDGALLLSGARWATPHLEVGETDEVVVDQVMDKLLAFRDRFLPAAAAPVDRTWARVVTHTCDGLPIIGPLPGDATRVACAGLQGLGPSLALAAAEAVVSGLLTGRSGLPSWCTPARFVQ